MQHTRARSLRAIVFAVVIALGGASPALAASAGGSTTDTLNIAATISVTGVPATATFTSPPACNGAVAGCLPTDFSYVYTAAIATNAGTGATVTATATALTSGAFTIPVANRGVVYGTADTAFTRNPAATTTNVGSLSPTVAFNLGSTSAPGTVNLGVEPLLRVDPAAYPAGSYSGSFTLTASTN